MEELLVVVPVLLVLVGSELDWLLDLLLKDPTPAPKSFNLCLTFCSFAARFAWAKGSLSSAAGAKMAGAFGFWAKMALGFFVGVGRLGWLTEGLGKPEDPTDNAGAGDNIWG